MNSDNEIIEKIIRGEKELFSLIVEKYEAKLLRYIKRFIWEADDAPDVLQNVFTRSYVYLNSFDKSQSFNAWIYRIAHNECINFLKKNKKFSGYSIGDILDIDTFIPFLTASEKSDDITNTRESKEEVEKYLNKMDSKYREVLILYFFEELSYEEIAKILQIPVSTVGVRLRRGKEKIKVLMEKDITINTN
jgi:RNA polymerase sigma-70 factor (ECF subfamily)